MSDRSPRFPNTDLKDAIEQVSKIFEADRRNPIERAVAARHMGYSGLSGASDKALGALMHYGLLEKSAKGEVAVTQLAVDILHPEAKGDRAKAISVAAFNPKVFSSIRQRYPDGHYSEESLKSYLVREGYTNGAVVAILKTDMLNRQFLRLEGANESGGLDPQKVEESNLPTETTGMPVSQVIVETASHTVNPLSAKAPEMPLPTEETRLGVGETEWMRNRVGTGTTVRILAKGDLGPREIGRLIKMLEAQKSVLEDDDE